MRLLRLLITVLAMLSIAGTSVALPEMLDSFNTKYNTKGTRLDTCDLCHIAGQPQISSCDEECHVPNKPQKIDPINLNPYGKSFRSRLNLPVDRALAAIENIDSAGDKIPNIDKIHNLKFPGNKKDNLPSFGNSTNNANNTNNGANNINLLSILINLYEKMR